MKPPTTPHYISRLNVINLWGDKSIHFDLYDDVNVIIGPNASGKTTIINLLMYTLTGNVAKLIDYQFDKIEITLKSFDKDNELIVKVTRTSEAFIFEVADKKVSLPFLGETLPGRIRDFSGVPPEIIRRHVGAAAFSLRHMLEGLVPAAWLPVSRRLPIFDEDDDERRRFRRTSMESVDECLSSLLEQLQHYRVSLDAKQAELRKEFQKHALENILYDKRHDRMLDRNFQAPSQADKDRLLQAFKDVGFVDRGMELRVEEHFKAAQKALVELNKNKETLTLETIFIMPLIHRTNQMVEFAQDLEKQRQLLFLPLSFYESTIGSFIDGKVISVLPSGELQIKEKNEKKQINWRHLSSGEKQLLILLTQALIWEKDPVVYVADEPELSLHVTWQEKLLKSITSLAGKCQIIVATHSPDVAGGFQNRIIDLAKV